MARQGATTPAVPVPGLCGSLGLEQARAAALFRLGFEPKKTREHEVRLNLRALRVVVCKAVQVQSSLLITWPPLESFTGRPIGVSYS